MVGAPPGGLIASALSRVASYRRHLEKLMKKSARHMTTMTALCLTGWAHVNLAHADTDVTYKISGFGTLGAVMTNTDDTEFRTAFEQQKGAGKSPDLGVDSKLALQGTLSFGEDFGVTAQILARRRDGEDFDPRFEWLYAQYAGVPNLNLKAGRVVLPAFLVSDTREVGYAIPWSRVPAMVYATMPVDTVDGFQGVYKLELGPTVLSLQGTHGHSEASNALTLAIPVAPGVTIYPVDIAQAQLRGVTSLSAKLDWDDWAIRAGSVTTDKVQLQGVGYSLEFKDRFTEVGLQYDNGKAVFASEYIIRKTSGSSVDLHAWYAAAGYRFDAVMPYLTYSEMKPKGVGNRDYGNSKSTGIGVRYDFAPKMALKAEFARYKTNNYFIFTDAVSPQAFNKSVNVFSVAVDFVF
jgi:hypothetical protein